MTPKLRLVRPAPASKPIFLIARNVRKATPSDAYIPMTLVEFHEIYPEGMREE